MPKYGGRYKGRRNPVWLFVLLGLSATLLILFFTGMLDFPAAGSLAPSPSPTPSESIPQTPTAATSPEGAASAAPSAQPETAPAQEPVTAGLGKPANAPKTSYSLAMELKPSHDRLYAMLRVNYENVTGDTLYELLFHLPPNAYQSASAPGAGESSDSYKSGFNKGGIIVSSVSVNGSLAYFTLSDDGLLLTVPFVKELLPGEQTELNIEFVVDVPERDGRFGKTELGYQLGNFLPILAVYQDGSWMKDVYAPIGDPYYSEAADYRVALRYPADYSLATTGAVTKTEMNGADRVSYIAATQVRDFACMLGFSMQHAAETAGGVEIHSYALSDGSAGRGAVIAKNVLHTLSPILGNYPYSTLTVAQADMAYAGMEYPNLLMVQRELYLPGRELELELTIAHEILHQWFYGLVGSDQYNAPWLDEALTGYISLVYFEQVGNTAAYEALKTRYLVERAKLGGQIDGALSSYAAEDAYVNAAYWRGAAMYAALREKIGDEAFFNGLRAYIKDNSYGIATKADVVRAFEEASGLPLADWIDAQLAAPKA